MITRNFDNLMNMLITGDNPVSENISDKGWLSGVPGVVKAYNAGACYYVTDVYRVQQGCFGGSGDNYASSPSNNYPTLLVGSGDSEESYNDYTIDIITSLSVSSYRGNAYATANGVHSLVMTKTFVNNTDADVVVNELGMFKFVTARPASTSSTYGVYALVAREKLAEPVTIPANGGVATFSMTITLPVVNSYISE